MYEGIRSRPSFDMLRIGLGLAWADALHCSPVLSFVVSTRVFVIVRKSDEHRERWWEQTKNTHIFVRRSELIKSEVKWHAFMYSQLRMTLPWQWWTWRAHVVVLITIHSNVIVILPVRYCRKCSKTTDTHTRWQHVLEMWARDQPQGNPLIGCRWRCYCYIIYKWTCFWFWI